MMNKMRRKLAGMLSGSSIPILYEAVEITTETDTGIKLFDTPMDWTILIDVTSDNYYANNRIISLSQHPNNFRLGGISNGNDYTNGEFLITANRYCAGVLNVTSTDMKCISLAARYNGEVRRKFALRYISGLRQFLGVSDSNITGEKYYYLDSDLIVNDTLTICNNSSSNIHTVKIYGGAMDLYEMIEFVNQP